MNELAREISNSIYSAFPAKRPAGVDSLGKLANIIATRDESARFANVDSWHDVDSAILSDPDAGIHAALLCMPPKMWAYYLPAWLTACLEHGPASLDLFVGAVGTLSPMSLKALRRDAEAFLAENVAELSLTQADVILSFLKYTMSLPDVERIGGPELALDAISFWEERVLILAQEDPSSTVGVD